MGKNWSLKFSTKRGWETRNLGIRKWIFSSVLEISLDGDE